MAKSNFKKMTSIKDTENGNFGGYDEYNGGGSPKGGIWGGADGRVGWSQREKQGEIKQGEHRENQPRTNDGKFTYNSVNGKETKYESRGETVNPLLTGGKNGIKIEDVETQFKNKQGSLYDKYKDKWYRRGDKRVSKEGRKHKIQVANESIWNIAKKSFDLSNNELTGESTTWSNKKGSHSNVEKQAISQARANKEEQFVANPNGGIAQHTGQLPNQPAQTTGAQFTFHPSVLKRIAAAKLLGQPGGMSAFASGTANLNSTQSQFNTQAAGNLKGNQKFNFTINPTALQGLKGAFSGFTGKAQQQPQKKVSMAGFFKKKN